MGVYYPTNQDISLLFRRLNMPMVKKSISLTEQQDGWIKAQIKTGHYGNESEVVRDLIRERQIREQARPVGIEAIRNVSEPESLPYAVRVVAAQAGSGSDTALDALNQLQTSLRERKIDTALWEQDLIAERQASDRRLSPAPK